MAARFVSCFATVPGIGWGGRESGRRVPGRPSPSRKRAGVRPNRGRALRMSDDLVGVWRLVSHRMEDVETGERTEPFGAHPRGTLIFHPDGRMVALITPGERPAAAAAATSGSPSLIAYSGRYRCEPPDRLITSVDIASIEAWVGTDQVRSVRCDRGPARDPQRAEPPAGEWRPGGGRGRHPGLGPRAGSGGAISRSGLGRGLRPTSLRRQSSSGRVLPRKLNRWQEDGPCARIAARCDAVA